MFPPLFFLLFLLGESTRLGVFYKCMNENVITMLEMKIT
jgi:hypothetical protein